MLSREGMLMSMVMIRYKEVNLFVNGRTNGTVCMTRPGYQHVVINTTLDPAYKIKGGLRQLSQ